ncbi:MerR family transcriptional regulator [Peptoniphilus sp. AGMB00490]|uniref:MerR family transcriptional regulator n=1 Tax=Peptoniphilus faecalis TaxID=2731255 RepID=A0A848RJA5_9FIRM|nr:MerR family transcriptional regulator [Peptoniphilus faecalis]NMW84402.1 MerR family transcriptional regulator [Peptoniphilus faecalis]
MRTGKFSEITGLSKDTIYYYIEKGLIYPDKKNKRFSFNRKNVEDIEIIKLYQDMNFSLDEIVSILSLWNWSNNTEERIQNEHLNRLLNKKKEIDDNISILVKKKHLITNEISRISYKSGTKNSNEIFGFPIDKLNILSCPICNNLFIVENATINSKYIFNANLKCSCGYEMKIVDGIVRTGNIYENQYDTPDVNRDLYLNMPAIYYKSLNKIGNYISKYLNEIDLENKIIMETNINGFSFLYNNLKYFKNNFTIILIDKFEEVLINYKSQLSKILNQPNIILIADDSLKYPIKNNSVDIVISLFSCNEHQLYKKENYFQHINKYIAKGGSIIGAYQSYKNNCESLKNLKIKYPESSDNLYNKDDFILNLKNTFSSYYFKDIEKVDAYAKKHSFECHKKGELMTHSIFKAVKK